MATTVQVTSETKKKLDKIGNKGDTYDDIINQLADQESKTAKGDS
jgi:predicted transcriptional regulator